MLGASASGAAVVIVADLVAAWDETQRSRFTPPSWGCDSAWAVELGA